MRLDSQGGSPVYKIVNICIQSACAGIQGSFFGRYGCCGEMYSTFPAILGSCVKIYGVATISRLLKIIRLFGEYRSLL